MIRHEYILNVGTSVHSMVNVHESVVRRNVNIDVKQNDHTALKKIILVVKYELVSCQSFDLIFANFEQYCYAFL